jgi:hypothetical protein
MPSPREIPPRANPIRKAKLASGNCFYCKGDGHWKSNCPKYLELVKGKGKMPFEGILLSHDSSNVNSSNSAWVLDTGASSHI